MVRDIGTQLGLLERRFARDGVRYFHDEAWLQKIFAGRTKKRTEHCKVKDGFLCAIQDTLVVFESTQN